MGEFFNVTINLLQSSLLSIIPLLIVALGGLFSERSGVVNIALEGLMLIGAFFGIMSISILQAYTSFDGQLLFLLALLIGGLAGMLFSLLHSYASVTMKADQVISGTAINILAPAFAIYFARIFTTTQQIGFNDTFLIKSVPVLSQIPFFGPILFSQIYISTYVGIIILVITYYVIYKTKFGLRLRACGENPHAADSAGINIYKYRYAGVSLSGFLAGLGGVAFIVPTATEFNATVSGYGFLALAVLIFGQWRPTYIFLAAIFFGFTRTISSAYIQIPFLVDLDLPSEIYSMIPYIATIVVLGFTSKNSKGPRAAGEPYDKGKR
jgi:simple sugar transport system permease protein